MGPLDVQHVVVGLDLTTQRFYRLLLRKRQKFLSEAEKTCLRVYQDSLDSLSIGTSLDHYQAESFLLKHIVKLESNIKHVCEKHDTLSMLLLARRLRPQDLGYRHSGTLWNVFRTLTLAVLKYCDSSLPTATATSLVGGEMHFRINVAHNDVADVLKLLLLCEHYYSATCCLRYVRKSASILLGTRRPIAQPDETLRKAVDLYDSRLDSARCSPFDVVGLLHEIEFPTTSGNPFMFFCVPNEDEDSKPLTTSDETWVIELPPPSYYPGLISLRGLLEYLCLFRDSVRSTYGCEPEQLFNLVQVLCAWLLLRFKETAPTRLYQYSQRGLSISFYSVLRREISQLIRWASKMFVGDKKSITSESAIQLLEKFSISPKTSRTNIDLRQWEPKYAFYILQDKLIIDLLAISEFIKGILWKVQLSDTEKNIKGNEFENELADYLLKYSPKARTVFPPRKKLKLKGKLKAEIDLSIGKNSICFVVDCKSYSINRQLFEGERQAVRNRWDTVLKWLRDNDERASFLAENPKGDNYDLPQDYSHVVPVVCSTHPEFLFDISEHFLLDRYTPRVCTPKELVEFLNSFNESVLASEPYAIRIIRK